MSPLLALRLLPACSLAALCLSGCALEPLSFWKDTPKAERSLTAVPPAPVAKKPGHETGLNVTYLPGYVRSPFTHPPRLVDVRGFRPGRLVVCPFTQKLFYLPQDFVDASPRSSRSVGPVHHLKREPAHMETVPPLTPAATPAVRDRDLPYGIAVSDRRGFVYSPYTDRSQMVDVSDIPAGSEVQCPYTGKIFRVPAVKR